MKYSKIILVVIAFGMISCVASGMDRRLLSPFVDKNEIRNNSDRRMSLDVMYSEARKEMDAQGGFFYTLGEAFTSTNTTLDNLKQFGADIQENMFKKLNQAEFYDYLEVRGTNKLANYIKARDEENPENSIWKDNEYKGIPFLKEYAKAAAREARLAEVGSASDRYMAIFFGQTAAWLTDPIIIIVIIIVVFFTRLKMRKSAMGVRLEKEK